MIQYFTDEGSAIPATLISAGPIIITAIKEKEKDGYTAVQAGYGEKKENRLSKAVKGHLKDLGNLRNLKEFRLSPEEILAYKKGDKIDASVFSKGDVVEVASTSKSKGFQGVVKRHGFAGGSRTHGQKHSEREPGSIGGGARAGGRVAKGIRMAGRMGGDRITVKNLKIIEVDQTNNQIVVSGAIPGRRGTLVEIRGK